MKDSLRTAVLLTALAALPMGGCIIINESGSGSSGSSGSSWSQERATVTRTASAADAKSVAVENRNGRVTITRDESVKELTVTAEIQCAGRTDEEAKQRADATTLEVTRDDAGLVRVRVKFAPVPDGVNGWGNDAANLDVKAPNLAGIEVVSSNGAIQVEGGFGGATRLRTSNGAIEGIGIGAPAQLETSNGSVDVQLTAGQTGNVEIRTSNGSVKLSLPASWQGRAEADTSNGRVSMDGGGRAQKVTVERNQGTMDVGEAGKASATVRSSNGSVTVRAAPAPRTTAMPTPASPTIPTSKN
jgi:DUF4097 and DUF4098 domain-containing protein YvlB